MWLLIQDRCKIYGHMIFFQNKVLTNGGVWWFAYFTFLNHIEPMVKTHFGRKIMLQKVWNTATNVNLFEDNLSQVTLHICLYERHRINRFSSRFCKLTRRHHWPTLAWEKLILCGSLCPSPPYLIWPKRIRFHFCLEPNSFKSSKEFPGKGKLAQKIVARDSQWNWRIYGVGVPDKSYFWRQLFFLGIFSQPGKRLR